DAALLRPLRSEFGLRGLKPGQVVRHPVEIATYVPPEWPVRYIALKINGKTIFATNRSPYTYRWDPEGLEPGRYILCVQLRRADREEPIVSPPLEVEVRRGR
ncbi:MAG: Ig-like domain-containing protein, partial [Armatimonadetes bacterium]|nr:Ig-like domain-containing protein [Armatimonadota bacterium]